MEDPRYGRKKKVRDETARLQYLALMLQREIVDKLEITSTYEDYLMLVADAVRANPDFAELISGRGREAIDAALEKRGQPALFSGEVREPSPAQVVADFLREMFPPKEA